ncbi:hypothetical protein Hanom_Chr03g00193011 [Helianthus anomalus]
MSEHSLHLSRLLLLLPSATTIRRFRQPSPPPTVTGHLPLPFIPTWPEST